MKGKPKALVSAFWKKKSTSAESTTPATAPMNASSQGRGQEGAEHRSLRRSESPQHPDLPAPLVHDHGKHEHDERQREREDDREHDQHDRPLTLHLLAERAEQLAVA